MTNPYEPPATYGVRLPPETDSYGQLKRQRQRRRYLLGVSLVWFAFIMMTGIYADNVRYMTSLPSIIGYGAFIVVGNVVCLACLALSVRGWWHLLVLPIWLFCLLELWVLVLNIAVGFGFIERPPRNSRSSSTRATSVLVCRPFGACEFDRVT